jgi:hypothetical protein
MQEQISTQVKTSQETRYTTTTTPNKVFDDSIEQPWINPPTKEEIKEQLRKKPFNNNEYQKQYLNNKKAAIREILQENVASAVKITNENLLKSFKDGHSKGRR